MKKRLLSLVMALCLVLGLAVPGALAGDNVLHISNARELAEFAQKCTLMEYSDGLMVQLDCDIDLEGEPFSPIPSFSGCFDGNGHSIKNFVLATDGSHQGLFRYLQEKGQIKNLRLEGKVEPGNSRCQVGGLVGSSYGSIENCVFSGTVTGLNYVGGIAGENLGSISGCTVEGTISGKRFTGGIAGSSSGSISNSENKAQVNTGISPGGLEIEKLNLEAMSLTGAEDTDVVSDSGGIVGFSTGLVEQCKNSGLVGYPHYGYNVGGIAGRQSGHITGCENLGEIYGRKDVGGIVGQMEPHLRLLESASLAEEIQVLQAMVSNLLANAGYYSDEMIAALGNIRDSAGQTAKDLLFPVEPEPPAESEPPTEPEPPVESEPPTEPEPPAESEPPTEPEPPAESEPPTEPEPPTTPEQPTEAEAPTEPAAAPETETAANTGEAPAESLAGGESQGGIVLLGREAHQGGIVLLSAAAPEEQQPPTIQDINDKLQGAAAELNQNQTMKDNLDQMAADMDYFNSLMGASSQALSGDLSAVGYQLSKVLVMMTNALSGQNTMDIFNDVSGKEPADSIEGRVKNCVNRGSIAGDNNVGGIAGDMGIEYEFDLENELMSIFTASNIIRTTYQSKCIASGCVNYGDVSAKKDNAGGIAGQSQVGLIDACQDYAHVSSSEGGFVGGIAGKSLAAIRASYVMAELAGEEYVGGIAGYGTEIKDCASLVEMQPTTACCGAIAGWADMGGQALTDNYYSHPQLGAVDGISYSGQAQAIAYEELLQRKGVPEEFSQLKLRFVADGKTVAELPFAYGGSIEESDLPPVPEKSGYTGKWADYDYSALYLSDTVEAVYTYRKGTLAVDNPAEGEERAIVLAEGDFDSKAQLSLRPFNGPGPELENGSVREKWALEIDGAGEAGKCRVHYLSPEPVERRGSIVLYRFEGGVWIPLDARTNGSYLVFDCQGNSTVFCAVEIQRPINTALLAGGGCLALAAAALLIARGVKKKKTKAGTAGG